MTELITKLISNAQTMVSPMMPVLGAFLIIKGLMRLAGGNDAAKGGAGGGKMIIIGSFLTCYKLTSWIIISTLTRCGLYSGNAGL
ncbi:MAG: hypothetical protein PHC90_01820 [Syntrophorhabdaceae bacterium]|nr:hypothetical protein [Syntrophorhabdaceae bacterium]